jgi:hypothetical protein
MRLTAALTFFNIKTRCWQGVIYALYGVSLQTMTNMIQKNRCNTIYNIHTIMQTNIITALLPPGYAFDRVITISGELEKGDADKFRTAISGFLIISSSS